MPRRRKGTPPPYLFHRGTGQAYSTDRGEAIYHGIHGTPESRAAYARFVDEWEDRHAPLVIAADVGTRGTIAEAVALHLAAIKPAISPAEYVAIRRNLATLTDRFGTIEPDAFRPAFLRELRDVWEQAGHHRKTINKEIGRVRRFFRWTVANERARPETLAALAAVPDLPRGTGTENAPIEPVEMRDFFVTIKRAAPRIRAMALVQWFAGPRPGEICRMKGAEIFRTGTVRVGARTVAIPPGVWLFMPEHHKTKKRGKVSVYCLGPRAQKVIRPFLRSNPDEPLFQPREARAEWEAAKRAARKTPVQPSQLNRPRKKAPKRKPGTEYTTASYGRAIEKAANLAAVPAWNPHQIRHAFATRMDAALGIVTTSEALGHGSLSTTAVYVAARIKNVAAALAVLG